MKSNKDIFDIYCKRVLPHVIIGNRMRDSSLALYLKRMMECFGDIDGKRVLDFGSGSGHKALLMSLCGADVTAVELDPQEVEHIKQSARDIGTTIEIIKGGVETLVGFSDNAFDCILLSEVFEHIPLDQVDSLRTQLARILSPNGRLFLTTPNFTFYGPAEDSPEYYQRFPFGHYKHYTVVELKGFFDRPPFKTKRHYFEAHPFTLLRHRIFYFIARYDYAVHTTKRYPFLTFFLRPISSIAYYFFEIIYPLHRWLHHGYEDSMAHSEKTGLTIMLDVTHE